MLDLLKMMVICGTLTVMCAALVICFFLVLLSLPKSRLRYFLIYFIPVVGQVTDIAAIVGGIAAALSAFTARHSRRKLPD
jgi:hypothetical protein